MQHNYRTQAVAQQIHEHCLGVRVGRLHRLIARRFEQALRPAGLSGSQLEVLTALTIHGGAVKPSQLADWLGAERSTVSRNLALMQDKGLVAAAACSASGRSMSVVITDSGTQTLRRAGSAWRAEQDALTELLGPDAAATLDTWLGQLTSS